MSAEFLYALGGASLLLAAVLPTLVRRVAVSAPMVLLTVGALIGLLPAFDGARVTPTDHRVFLERLAELCVLVSLMGVGLALDRPLDWRSWASWRRWADTWRLLAIAMPLCIAAVALLGWTVLGLAPAAAVLLGAALAPTDPVLASDVQVGGPTTVGGGQSEDEIDESDEVRFALTSEAGLNDGLAFPFVYAAILLATLGPVGEWGLRWVAWELVGKTAIGIATGLVTGWGLAAVAFRSRVASLRLAETGEPLLALAAVLLTYGVAEAVGGYGFLAVFTCAMTLRAAERGHDYHVHMHDVVERLERLLTLLVLLLLGVALTNGLLSNLTWPAASIGVLLVLVVRPVTALLALRMGYPGRQPRMGRSERLATAFFGVRGVGSVYYLAYATGKADFGGPELLWSTVGFTVALSVVVHGVAATPAMAWLDRGRAAVVTSGARDRRR